MADASRWIPVEARLPEDKQKCLLTTLLSGMKYVYVGTYATDLYSVNKHDFADRKGASGWYYRDSEYGYIEYDNVVAWMPLPDPYEPEEGAQEEADKSRQTEGRPSDGGRYLISALDGAWRRTTVAPYQPRYKAWTMTGRMAYWKVVAWQPLPEPYREDGEAK